MRPGRGAGESADLRKIGALILVRKDSLQRFGRLDAGSGAADLAFGKPLVHDGARKSGQFPGEFYVRQAARQQIVNRAEGHAEAGGELPLVFVFWRWRLARAGCGLL